jgi:hypothetical protein
MSEKKSSGSSAVNSGIGLGTVVAAIISWSTNSSLGYCILHGALGWLYVIYWMFYHWE